MGNEKLPSVDDFIEPPRPEEEIADLYNADSADYDFSSVGAGNTAVDTTPCSVEEAQDLTEIIRLISDVRKDIPEIPEIWISWEYIVIVARYFTRLTNAVATKNINKDVSFYDDPYSKILCS